MGERRQTSNKLETKILSDIYVIIFLQARDSARVRPRSICARICGRQGVLTSILHCVTSAHIPFCFAGRRHIVVAQAIFFVGIISVYGLDAIATCPQTRSSGQRGVHKQNLRYSSRFVYRALGRKVKKILISHVIPAFVNLSRANLPSFLCGLHGRLNLVRIFEE